VGRATSVATTPTAVRQALNKTQHSHFFCHGHFDADLTKAGLTLADCNSPDAAITRTYDNPFYWAMFVLIGDGK
jgi:CHAT domain-containing protein